MSFRNYAPAEQFRTVILDGFDLEVFCPVDWSTLGRTQPVLTMAGTERVLSVWLGPKEPLGISPLELNSLEIDFTAQEQQTRILGALSRAKQGALIEFYFGEPIADTWDLRAAEAGQVDFNLSRRHGWGLPGVDRNTFPAEAYHISTTGVRTTLEIVAAPAPASGQIFIPDLPGSVFTEIEANADLVPLGGLLEVHYPARYWVQLEEQNTIPGFGGWQMILSATERPPRRDSV